MSTSRDHRIGRYYIEEDMNTLNLRDGRTGVCLEDTSNWFLDGENADQRDSRHSALRDKAKQMNDA